LKIIVIYKIVSPSNKIYIGQTRNLKNRISKYINAKCHLQRHLYFSLLKYGWDNHQLEILENLEPECSQDLLNEREIFWYNHYFNLGYEMMNIKQPGLNGKLSSETKILISNSLKGEKNPMFNKTHSKEAKEKISRARKKYTGVNHPLYGKARSDKTKLLLREANLGKVVAENIKNKISNTLKGIKRSEEFKKKHCKPIIQKTLNGVFIREWDSIKEASKTLNISNGNISNCCSGRIKTFKGYVWAYK
jgi:group I intron endonuclease